MLSELKAIFDYAMLRQELEWWSLLNLYSCPIRENRDNRWSKTVLRGRLTEGQFSNYKVRAAGTAIIYSKYFIQSNQSGRGLTVCTNISTISINQTEFPFTCAHWSWCADYRAFALLSQTMSEYLWVEADEQQSCWTHARVCLFKSRQLQSYWLLLYSDHSNNPADPRQKTLEWVSLTAAAIWNALWQLHGVPHFDFANNGNVNILFSQAAQHIDNCVIRLESWNHHHREMKKKLLQQCII